MLEKIDVQVIYNDKYIATRIMPFKDEIRTNFHIAELSSIIIEVVVLVLNFFFFNDKISQVQKSTKKHQKAPKSTKKHVFNQYCLKVDLVKPTFSS